MKGLLSRLIQAVRSQNHFIWLLPTLWGAGDFGFVLMHPVSLQRKGRCTGSWHILSLLANCIQAHLHWEQGAPGAHCNTSLRHGVRHGDCEHSPKLPHVSEQRFFANIHALCNTWDIGSNVYWGCSCPREDTANNKQELAWKTERTFAQSCWQTWEFSALYRTGP